MQLCVKRATLRKGQDETLLEQSWAWLLLCLPILPESLLLRCIHDIYILNERRRTDCVDEVFQDIPVGLQGAVWALQGSMYASAKQERDMLADA